MRELINGFLIDVVVIGAVVICAYTVIGTSGNVKAIQKLAPELMAERNWKIMRREGFQYGSWSQHGGKVWYHVQSIDNPAIQYRVQVSMWNGELQYYYSEPENLNRINVNVGK